MSEKKRKTKAQRIYSVLSSRKRINQDLIEQYKYEREQDVKEGIELEKYLNLHLTDEQILKKAGGLSRYYLKEKYFPMF